MNQHLVDNAIERAVLGGVYSYGESAYIDVADIIQQSTSFGDETNQTLWKCYEYLFDKKGFKNLDLPALMSAANELGYSYIFSNKDELSHVKSILNSQVRKDNMRLFAGQIRKLHIARELKLQLETAVLDINKITGQESIDSILAIAENAVFDFSNLLNKSTDSEPKPIGQGIREYFRHLALNPVEQVGISSGMKYYDEWIGGGFRRKTVSLLGARTGVGKSMISDNVALHITGELNIPVLYLDTEMSSEDHWNRLGANISDIAIKRLETGKFGKDKKDLEQVKAMIEKVESIPFDYLNISGKPFEETLSIMRRWIKERVGYDENGRVKDCLIIYDYIKMMSAEGLSASLQEYQVLGFMMTSLHNFAVRNDVPIFALVQLNRDGIDKETTDVVSGSDRVVWLATNLAVFKPKSDEDVGKDGGLDAGTHKLIVIKARHGGGTPYGDYLNIILTGDRARIEEGETRSNVAKKQKQAIQKQENIPPEIQMDIQAVPFEELDAGQPLSL